MQQSADEIDTFEHLQIGANTRGGYRIFKRVCVCRPEKVS